MSSSTTKDRSSRNYYLEESNDDENRNKDFVKRSGRKLEDNSNEYNKNNQPTDFHPDPPTRAAVYEFLAHSNKDSIRTTTSTDSKFCKTKLAKWIDWKRLPQRLDRLCQSIEDWVSVILDVLRFICINTAYFQKCIRAIRRRFFIARQTS
jgi:hypothetical protein